MEISRLQTIPGFARVSPTTKLLQARGAKVILLAHFGRPKGKPPADLIDIVWPFCVNM
jgi:3-phosphoglycerate kinase